MTRPVFVSPEVLVKGSLRDLSFLSPGDEAIFTGPEARHARKVMRLGVGEAFDLVDGGGHRITAKVTLLPPGTGEAVGFTVEESRFEEQAAPKLTLVQALVKGARADQAVETATEVGADAFVPWIADRSVSRWKPNKYDQGRERWRRVAQAASKQSRRAHFPAIEAPVTTKTLAKRIEQAVEDGKLVFLCHEDAELPASIALKDALESHPEADEILFLVGPEGGFSEKETGDFQNAGATLIGLGENVLRASTAGPAAVVTANVALGRW